MFNLLPTIEKKKILNEYRIRLTIIIIIAIGALVLASLELLVPSYFLASIKNKNAQATVEILEEKYGDNTKEKELAVVIKNINKKIMLLGGEETATSLTPTELIDTVLGINDGDIKMGTISYDLAKGKERVIVSGVARNRDSLSSFVEALKDEPSFTTVTLPISSYVKSKDISFSIVMGGIKKVVNKKP